MNNLALLVDCHKIITWLDDRKKIPKDWYDYVKAAEEKIKALLKNHQDFLKYPILLQYLKDHEETFHYCDVIYFVDELLLRTDLAHDKSMIFGYSDKRVKEWNTLKKYMDNRSIGLLNTAKFIEQTLAFDAPGIDKSIELIDSQKCNLKRKIDFNENTIYQQYNLISKQKSLLGLNLDSSKNIEIQELAKQLIHSAPLHMLKLHERMLQKGLKSYIDVMKNVNQANGTDNTLNTLEFYLNNGDQFLQVFKHPELKELYLIQEENNTLIKYAQFTQWKPHNQWEIQIQGIQLDSTIHANNQCINFTILQNRQTRQQLTNNLNQMLYFFKGLKYEMTNASKGLGFDSQTFGKLNLVEGDVDKAIENVTEIIQFLASKQLVSPIELKNSKKIYQIFVNTFRNYESNIAAMKEQNIGYKKQIQDLEINRNQQVNKLASIRAKAVASKNHLEKWITQLVKKDVKITGEINRYQN